MCGSSQVARYVGEHESGARALVHDRYRGRGRVTANESPLKAGSLRDALLRRRSDEALVRLVGPVGRSAEGRAPADARASRTAREAIRLLSCHVPT